MQGACTSDFGWAHWRDSCSVVNVRQCFQPSPLILSWGGQLSFHTCTFMYGFTLDFFYLTQLMLFVDIQYIYMKYMYVHGAKPNIVLILKHWWNTHCYKMRYSVIPELTRTLVVTTIRVRLSFCKCKYLTIFLIL